LRALQLGGCVVCLDIATRQSPTLSADEPRRYLLAAWRGVDLYDRRERAALALTEELMNPSAATEPSTAAEAPWWLGRAYDAVVETIVLVRHRRPPHCHAGEPVERRIRGTDRGPRFEP
jgi:hypothetical protein